MDWTREETRKYKHKWDYAQGNTCKVCKKPITSRATYCNKHRPRKHTHDKTQKYIINGYVRVWNPDKRYHWVLEHRYVWEKTYGPIPKGWWVHHINGIKTDNRLENLFALPCHNHKHLPPTKSLLKKAQARIRELETKQQQLSMLNSP